MYRTALLRFGTSRLRFLCWKCPRPVSRLDTVFSHTHTGSLTPLLRLEVKSHSILKDSFLGRVCVPLSELLGSHADVEWHELEKRSENSNVRGRIQFAACVTAKGVQAQLSSSVKRRECF